MGKRSEPAIKIDITDEEINRRLDQIESAEIADDLKKYIVDALMTLVELDRLVGLQKTTIARLRKIFGKKSERSKNNEGDGSSNNGRAKSNPKPKSPGHGRNGHGDYPDSNTEYHPIKDLKAGDPCPTNDGGVLYDNKPRVHISISGSAPFVAKKIIHQTLRCGLCGLIFEAKSWATGKPKYDVTVRSMLSILHYGSSFPMYRLEKLQKKFFTPMPRSVQWMLLVELGLILAIVYEVLLDLVSNSDSVVMSDDTKAKIQSHINRLNMQKRERARLAKLGIIEKKSEERIELSTTGMRTIVDGHEVVVFITGKKNSGENIDEMLKRRTNETKMMVIGDASSKNNPSDIEQVEMLNCNVHARREFLDLGEKCQEETDKVKEWYKEIYKNEAITKERGLSPQERLIFHQEHSGPIMNELKKWCEFSIAEKRVEPNSPLGGAIKYILKHWPGLTGFLRIEGCPLDTNILEGYLRTAVMNRKNWLHLKTEYGAFINDVNLSIIRSCEASGENVYMYLNALQNNEAPVRKSPEKWLPWNYRENLPKESSSPTEK